MITISKLMVPTGPANPKSEMRFLHFRDGLVNIIILKEHVTFIFEPKNKHGYKIIRIYKNSGKLIKQWKGLSFHNCLVKHGLFQKNNGESEITRFPDSLTLEDGVELSFYSEAGSTIWGYENKEISIYDIFTNLHKYK